MKKSWYEYGYIMDDGSINAVAATGTKAAAEKAAAEMEHETGEQCGVVKVYAKPVKYIRDYGYNCF